MIEIRKTAKPMEKTADTKEIIGQKVIAKDGGEIGKIYSVRLDPGKKEIEGIIANKGLFASDYYIGKDYIDRLNEEGAVLNIKPVEEFVDKEIFDSAGSKVGKVKEVKRVNSTNDLFAVIVNVGVGKDDLIIHENMVEEIGDNVLLNKPIA